MEYPARHQYLVLMQLCGDTRVARRHAGMYARRVIFQTYPCWSAAHAPAHPLRSSQHSIESIHDLAPLACRARRCLCEVLGYEMDS